MNSGIFISYRRDDTRHVAGRLAGDLADRFGESAVFRDVDSIGAGLDFTTQLEEALSHCAVMLVLIGPRWLPLLRERMDKPDWVRQEIAAALQRGVRVVPVLVEDARLPAASDLPPDLQPLVNRQARSLSDERWRGDALVLIEMLAKLPGIQATAPAPAPAPAHQAAPVAAAPAAKAASSRVPLFAGVALVVLGGGYALFGMGDPPADATAENLIAAEPTAAGAAPAAPALPDIGGNWRAGDGWTYNITQSGPDGEIAIQLQGADAGKGTVRLEGDQVTMTMHVGSGDQVRSDECDLTLGEDLKSMVGKCTELGTDEKGQPHEPYDYALKR
jgi:hypothetical protein